MKKSIKVLFFVLAITMLSSLSFLSVNAESEDTHHYTVVVEQVCQEPALKRSSVVDRFSAAKGDSYSGKYGDQLSGVAKEVYASMVKQFVTDGKTGVYTYTYNTPFVFKVDEVFMGVVMSGSEYYSVKKTINNAVQMAQDAFLYDYPQLFWLRVFSSSYSISTSCNSSEGYKAEISNVTITPYETYVGASDKISRFNASVDNVLSSIDTTGSRYDILKNIHDYICEKSWYYSYGGKVIYTSEPFFIGDGGMVCEGYAEAFKILCDKLGIPCALVVGNASGPHMWNYVQMEDGRWYLVDATWDDGDNEISHIYFIANSNTVGAKDVPVNKERTEDGDFSDTDIMIFAFPELSGDEYGTEHTHRWRQDYTIDKAATCTKKGSKSIHCQSCDEKKDVTEIPATNHANKKKKSGKAATCEESGYTEGYYCSDCSKWVSGHEKIEPLSHSYQKDKVRATLNEDGKIIKSCVNCDYEKTTVIYRVKTVSLSTTAYVYNGKVKTPEVTVKDRKGNVLNKNEDYTVSYESGRKDTGKYTVKITFKGNYSGTKRVYFTIAPKAPSELKVSQTTKTITLKWSKVTGAEGYRIYQYDSKNKKWKNIKTTSERKLKLENLKSGTEYKFEIKAYKKDDGTIWSDATEFIVATKPAKVTLSKVIAGSKQATLNWNTVTGASGYEIQYSTSDEFKKSKKVTVKKGSSKKTTIKNLSKGKKYYFKVRAYKTVDGKKIYGAYSSVKSVKIK